MRPDHRSRVGAERRKRMQDRLVSSALQLIAAHGWSALSVDRIIASAGVSRGSFYKYFESIEVLARQIATSIANDLVSHAGPLVQAHADPALRVATGVRVVMHTCASYPVIGHCIATISWADLRQQQPLLEYVWRDIDAGLSGGRFMPMPLELGVSALVGITISGVQVMLDSGNAELPEMAAAMVLRSLGVSPEEAGTIARMPLPETATLPGNLIELTRGV